MKSDKIRSFICIDLPSEIVKELTRIQELLEKKQFTGKLTEPENLHLTLKFLGEIDKPTLQKVKERLNNLESEELNLRLSHAGTFRYKGIPRIVWVKLLRADKIQKKIDNCLESIFPKEKRFMSHLTIARIKYVKNKRAFYDTVNNLPLKRINFKVNNIKLISSELTPQGPIYTPIKEYKLT